LICHKWVTWLKIWDSEEKEKEKEKEKTIKMKRKNNNKNNQRLIVNFLYFINLKILG